jgi:hypothetical protein
VRLEVRGKQVAAGAEADPCGMTTRKAKAKAKAGAGASVGAPASASASASASANTGVSPLRITKTKA